MAEFFLDYGLFLAKIITVVIAIVAIAGLINSFGTQARKSLQKGHVEMNRLNDDLATMKDAVRSLVISPEDLKQERKLEKKQQKEKRKKEKQAAKIAARQRGAGKTVISEPRKKRVFVLEFDGDIRATAVSSLRREITAVLSMAEQEDEIVVKLDSGGGMVTSYGLASSQLDRVKAKKIPLTVCIDKVAASGGYMMACVADKIIAAPFAVVGSVGVVAQIPNFHRLLKKHDIDFELLTAGEFKRTLTLFGENTDKGRQKFIDDLEEIHTQFKEFVGLHRPELEISAIATGETWSGQKAVDLKLVDELLTSDEYLVNACEEADVYEVKYELRKNVMEKLGLSTQDALESALTRVIDRLVKMRFFQCLISGRDLIGMEIIQDPAAMRRILIDQNAN